MIIHITYVMCVQLISKWTRKVQDSETTEKKYKWLTRGEGEATNPERSYQHVTQEHISNHLINREDNFDVNGPIWIKN